MSVTRVIETSAGEARITIDQAGEPRAALVLGHGAGGGITAPDLVALAKALPSEGITVVRVEQPYRVAGKKVGPRPAVLDQAWMEIIAEIRAGWAATARRVAAERPRSAGGAPSAGEPAGAAHTSGADPNDDPYKGPLKRKPQNEGSLEANLSLQGPLQRLVVGGRSAGARGACRTAKETGAAAVVALAFPLHPPGRPERSRAPELLGAGVPTLVVQGDRDPFGKPEEFPPGDYRLHRVPGADHGFAVPKSAQPGRAESLKIMADTVGDWLASVLD